jgi:hypothetical protein
MEKVCPRCGKHFACFKDSDKECYCSGISLSAAQRQFIAFNYDDCLCSLCLAAIKGEIAPPPTGKGGTATENLNKTT